MANGSLPRILILTAGFGEGHNTAAKGIQAALANKAQVQVLDLFVEAMPRIARLSQLIYLWIITYMPRVWKKIFRWTDTPNMTANSVPGLAPVRNLLAEIICDWQPDLVISTYMLYPYMLDALTVKTGVSIPYITVITDSYHIHQSWLGAQSSRWCVTDGGTRFEIETWGIDPERIRTTGFPVNPVLTQIRQRAIDWQSGEPFRILYFANKAGKAVQADLTALLASNPHIHITCILGKHFKRIYPRIHALQQAHRDRLTVRGWSRRVPAYLATHHLVISKAGGATVHECLAAGRPMLVNYRLHGQEDGNIDLLLGLGAGRFAGTPQALVNTVADLLANNAEQWRDMMQILQKKNRATGSIRIADLALRMIAANQKQQTSHNTTAPV